MNLHKIIEACEWAKKQGYSISAFTWYDYDGKIDQEYCCPLGAYLLQNGLDIAEEGAAESAFLKTLERDFHSEYIDGFLYSFDGGYLAAGVTYSKPFEKGFYDAQVLKKIL